MASILIITLIALMAFLLLTGLGIVRDVSRLWLRRSKAVFCNRGGARYYSELVVTLMVVLVMAISSSLLKGAATILLAMFTTDDIAQFTTALRGVFSSFTTELQSPRNHLVMFFFNPPLKMIAVFSLVSGIKLFFAWINKKAGVERYNEADVLYFGSIGIIFLISMEILCHIQDVKMANSAGNIAYLLLDKFAYILYFLTFEEIVMIRSNKPQLVEAIDKYLVTNRMEKRLVLSMGKMVALAYVLGLLLSLPCFLGLQWMRSNMTLITAFIIVLGVALYVMKRFFAEGWNLIGTVIFANAFSMPINGWALAGSRSRRPVFIGLIATGALLAAFGIAFPKQLLMFLLILNIAVFSAAFGIVVCYLLAWCVGLIVVGIAGGDTVMPAPTECFAYLGWVLTSLFRAVAVPVVVVTLAFMVITCFPKEFDFDNVVKNSAVVDTNGDWLYIDAEQQGHYYAPLRYDELPEFFKKALVNQEDRGFFHQHDLLPNRSNWNGISLSVLKGRGGSNLNSQLVKNITFLDADGFPRDLARKIVDMIGGYMLSVEKTPEEIMEAYVNIASFHGSMGYRGLNAASLFAFGRPVNKLNKTQQLYLVNTLPRSVYVKGERDRIAYYSVQNDSTGMVKKVLLNKAERWCDEGLISRKELNTLKREKLEFTNCRYVSDIPLTTRVRMEKKLAQPGRHLSYITLNNEQALTRAYNELRKSNYFRKNGSELEVACIVVDVHNGHIIAHFNSGMIDYAKYRDGFPIGSLGKPFIVVQMLEMGASPNLTLFDGPEKGRKTPKNANHGWSKKEVTITEALSKSLNAPFVNICDIMEPRPLFINTEKSYKAMGIRSEQSHRDLCSDTYNYPIGTSRQMYLTEIAQIYQVLMADGVCYPLREHEKDDTIVPVRIYHPENVAVVKQALSQTVVNGTMKAHRNSLPNGRTYYAKTGTSTRQQYGFGVLSDGDLLVVSFASYGRFHDGNMKLGVEPLYGGSTAGLMSVLAYKEIIESVKSQKPC